MSSAPEQVHTRSLPTWLDMLVLLLAIAAPLWHLHIFDRNMPLQKNDLVPRWIGTRDALHGMDPYSPAVTREIQTAYYGRPLTPADRVDGQEFFYPAYLVPLLAPLTWLPWHVARLAFLIGLLPCSSVVSGFAFSLSIYP